uniref:Uncharacterized protein n=1 Tax=Ditylenchus dipsaci TaxID=166011 RepID=A0A915CMA2_9BILA
MKYFLILACKFMILVLSLKLSLAQNSSSSTEIIDNGRTNCPAAGSSEYNVVPFHANQSEILSTTLISISIVPANGGPAIANYPISDGNFRFDSSTPIRPYACEQCHTPMWCPNTTLIQEMPFVVPCQSDYERPNIVLSFQSSDGRQGEWVITPEHWTSTRPPLDSAGTICEFVFATSPNQFWYSSDFHARHYCQARNMADRTLGLAGSTIIH